MQAWLEMLSQDNMKTIITAFILLGIYLEFELRTRKPNVALKYLWSLFILGLWLGRIP